MKANLKVKRYNPEDKERPEWFQEYQLDVHPSATILDALIQVREEMDGTLALRCSCRASICGSCGMRVDDRARLVCKTRLAAVAPNSEQIKIEPLGNHRVIRDLAVELEDFFAPLARIKPYLEPTAKENPGEYIASNESMTNLLTSMNCIMCGCCVSDCTVLEIDKQFLGPAILAKAWRFVEDPRDAAQFERLTKLNDEAGGMWDCTRCMQCVEVCPKDVAPMDRIMELRELAIEKGLRNTSGYRHTESFNRSVKKYGRLDEARLAVDSAGLFNLKSMFELALVGIKAVMRGKLPPILPHKAQDNQAVRRVFEKVEQDRG